MKLIVTGSSSFIGRRLVSHLEGCGHEVVSVGRRESIRWKLGEAIPAIENATFLIHLAYDRSRNTSDSIRDTQAIISSYSGKIIYLSSMSAHSRSKSIYGRRKYLEECLFITAGATVLKVGLVIGREAEGVFGKLRVLIERFQIIPVPLKGKPLFYITQIEDLVKEVNQALTLSKSGLIRASSKSPILLEDLIKQIVSELGLSRRQILIPKYPIHFVLFLLKVFSARLHLLDSYFSMTVEITSEEVENFLKPSSKFKDFDLK
jgi:nucleoside-diphosphate-sugar epimerase